MTTSEPSHDSAFVVAVAGTIHDRPAIPWSERKRLAQLVIDFLAQQPGPVSVTQLAIALSLSRESVGDAIHHELYSSPDPRIVRVGRWMGVHGNPYVYGIPGTPSADHTRSWLVDLPKRRRPGPKKKPKPPKPPKPPSLGQLRVEQVTALLAERGPMSRRAISEATGLDRQVIDRMMAGENKWSRGRFAVLDTAPSLPQPTKLYGVAA